MYELKILEETCLIDFKAVNIRMNPYAKLLPGQRSLALT
jgi:hypothetical protein